MSIEVAVLVGSLRDKSFNHRLALALQKLGPSDWSYTNVRIDEVPYYDADDEKPMPDSVRKLTSGCVSSSTMSKRSAGRSASARSSTA